MQSDLRDTGPRRTAGWRRGGAIVVVLLLAAVLGGCASRGPMQAGRIAEQLEDYDRAVIEYTRQVQADPQDLEARRALERASLRAAQQHYSRGRALSRTERYEEALLEMQIAADLNPTSGIIDDALRETRRQVRDKLTVDRDGQTALEALVERAQLLAPANRAFLEEVTLPDSLVFRDASSRDIFTAIGQFAGISLAFDPSFEAAAVSIDLRNATLAAALDSLTSATRSFYRVTAPQTVTIIPDTPAKRREYEEEIVRTFYLSNADLQETIDLLRIVMDLRRLAPIAATNALTVKDTPERVEAAARIIQAIDKARPEVVISVELLEVDRTRLREYGLQLASPTDNIGIDGQVDVNQQNLTLEELANLTQSNIFVTGVPSLFYRLLKRDQNTRTLASPHLRTAEGIPAQARFGERVPVPVTTFAPIATGGVNQQPITSFNYENIGVNIDITPRTHHDDDISLALQVEVSNISGTGFGDLPTFGNRFINTTIRLRDGETNLLAGLIRDDERYTLEGIPGLSDLPIVGRLFARNKLETQETDIILTLTPHIIRVLDVGEADLRPFTVARDTAPGFGDQPIFDIPSPDESVDEIPPGIFRPITPPTAPPPREP